MQIRFFHYIHENHGYSQTGGDMKRASGKPCCFSKKISFKCLSSTYISVAGEADQFVIGERLVNLEHVGHVFLYVYKFDAGFFRDALYIFFDARSFLICSDQIDLKVDIYICKKLLCYFEVAYMCRN